MHTVERNRRTMRSLDLAHSLSDKESQGKFAGIAANFFSQTQSIALILRIHA